MDDAKRYHTKSEFSPHDIPQYQRFRTRFYNIYDSTRTLRDVRYSTKKTEGYLLNINHPKGGAKAKFMKDVLGYSQNDSKMFHKNVVSSLIGKIPSKSETTPFGIKHTYNIKLAGKDGKSISANAVVVIQKDNGRLTYKIVTVYPDKKGK